MHASIRLLAKRRFLPLFVTQFLGAFNDNLFKTAMVLFVTYEVYSDPRAESGFNALATGLFILPFFLLSALSGQLADTRDKAKIIRLVKTAEILIMLVGASGLLLSSIPLMLAAVLAMGIHSTFFGPIKYAILPQHLDEDEVLGGTGLVEAGTYIAILAGTIIAGLMSRNEIAIAATVLGVAVLGWLSGRQVPPAPAMGEKLPLDFHVVRSSLHLVSQTMHIPRLFLAICAISFFWAIGSVLIVIFPPLVKNVFTADETVASLFLAIFSVGVAIGSVAINRLLGAHVSARFAPVSVIAMGVAVLFMFHVANGWQGLPDGQLYGFKDFIAHPGAIEVFAALFAVAVSGGMFVVPLYAFLTTTVPKDQTARTVAANNIVNSGAMVIGSLAIMGLTSMGVTVVQTLLLVAAMCLVSAWIAWKLHKACD
ncbi:Predicted arabinose efflux permease, MFS family [Sphingomonas laterariae]|uniref:Predicted arabinose efflux permease, MFS family n=1 Tax=Edaphosphingomonas laterariae TaxID=861865 RepID=A0A239DUP8_9SPHN|nr:MFS transporter [Sphingomonas laterariae]SNS36176.1 Predicted arabinose efflux permease, MFS family [Sphingomonas laterariae]